MEKCPTNARVGGGGNSLGTARRLVLINASGLIFVCFRIVGLIRSETHLATFNLTVQDFPVE